MQIVHHLTSLSYEDTQSVILSPESQSGTFLRSLSQRFEESKNHFKPRSGFLRPQDEGMTDAEAVAAFRNGNLATFLSAVWNLHPIALYYLNEHFLETFVIEGHRLLAAHAQLFLELKTIMFVRSTGFQFRDREDILRELFPADLEKVLLARRPGITTLAESEATFVKDCAARRECLLRESANEVALQALKEKYEWQGFVQKIMSYVQKHFVDLVGKEVSNCFFVIYDCKMLTNIDCRESSKWNKALATAPSPTAGAGSASPAASPIYTSSATWVLASSANATVYASVRSASRAATDITAYIANNAATTDATTYYTANATICPATITTVNTAVIKHERHKPSPNIQKRS